MPRRETPPFRADHVGSLLRPPELTRARAAHRAGEIDAAALRDVEDAAIRDVIALQREAGMQTVTDGEFRRSSWHMDFIYALGGVEQVEGESIHVQFRSADGELDFNPPAMRVTAPITPARDDLRRRVQLPARQRGAGADPEADHPVAEHGPLSRRPGGNRRVRVSRDRRVLG